jgi:hypothetical protein
MLASVDQMTEEEFELHFADTPFSRPGLSGMRRNMKAACAKRSALSAQLVTHDP